MNQGYFKPEASIPKYWGKKIINEPTSMQKIANKMGYGGKNGSNCDENRVVYLWLCLSIGELFDPSLCIK